MDLGVDFFPRMDRLNPDQHPAWTSGSGLIEGEGMIMAGVGEGFNLRLSDLNNYVCCGVFGVYENLPTLRGPRPQTQQTRRDHPIPARATPRPTQKANLITTWSRCLYKLKDRAQCLQTHRALTNDGSGKRNPGVAETCGKHRFTALCPM